MKIDTLDSSSAIRKTKQKKSSSGFFSLPDSTDDDSEIGTITTSAKIPSLNPFLTLQEVGEQEYNQSDDQKLLDQGGAIINYLKDIRLGLINGDLNIDNIRNLKNIIESQKYRFTTLEAQKLYDEIYLRASVELAKLERSQKNID